MNDQEMTFVLTVDEANIILNALLELPAKTSMGVIQKIQQQAQTQIPTAEITVESEENIEE